jgi:predicted Holliday junction resolvase-like endonuclease
MVVELIWYVVILMGLLLALMVCLYRRAWHELAALKSSKQSLSTKYGRLTEQFMPFMKDYPFDSHNFRFLGTPVDGVQFEPDKIVFVEFKSGDSRLTARQREIKHLVLSKKVEFREFRVG